MSKNVKIKAIIVAAGKGKRMEANKSKQYILLRNKPVLTYTLEVFQNCKEIDEIILVVGSNELEFCRESIVKSYGLTKVTSVIEGGKERYHSVHKGLMEIQQDCHIVIIHDGARPFITEDMIVRSIEVAQETGAVITGVPVKDTIKLVNNYMEVSNTPDRKNLWAIQTPQTFKYSIIKDAYEKVNFEETITDDASLVERAGYPVKVIMGDYQNIKLTTPDDLLLAEEILKKGELV